MRKEARSWTCGSDPRRKPSHILANGGGEGCKVRDYDLIFGFAFAAESLRSRGFN